MNRNAFAVMAAALVMLAITGTRADVSVTINGPGGSVTLLERDTQTQKWRVELLATDTEDPVEFIVTGTSSDPIEFIKVRAENQGQSVHLYVRGESPSPGQLPSVDLIDATVKDGGVVLEELRVSGNVGDISVQAIKEFIFIGGDLTGTVFLEGTPLWRAKLFRSTSPATCSARSG